MQKNVSSVIFASLIALAPTAVDATPQTHAKGDVVVLEDPDRGLEVIGGPDGISWCHEEESGRVACGESEQPIGCQYFGEEGPDDLAVCILSTLANLCCSCLAVCDDDQQTADPVQVVETIVDALDPSTFPSCGWESGAAGYCSYMCDGRQLAGCARVTSDGDLMCKVGEGPYTNYGPQPTPCD